MGSISLFEEQFIHSEDMLYAIENDFFFQTIRRGGGPAGIKVLIFLDFFDDADSN